ncbi:molybdopterin synthase catalytic subunit [Gammaproteobacteria bacterium]
MKIELRGQSFDPWQELARHESDLRIQHAGDYGAAAVFVGSVRDFNVGEMVHALVLEHYPGMTERHLETITREAVTRWELIDALVLHRYGKLAPNDPIVLVAAWSAHRAEAFAACRYLIEELKSRVPFWKQETLPTGPRWVTHNTPG